MKVPATLTVSWTLHGQQAVVLKRLNGLISRRKDEVSSTRERNGMAQADEHQNSRDPSLGMGDGTVHLQLLQLDLQRSTNQ
jgi:hypothetical protein